MNRRSYDRFAALIAAFDWQGVYDKDDTDEAFLYFHKNLKLIYDRAF